MLAYLLIPLIWPLIGSLVLYLIHRELLCCLWREPALVRPVVIVESDDWGPGPASDALMLQRISTLLAGIRDREGRPVVMTLGVVLGKPDGAAILADDCRRYHRRLLDEEAYAPIVDAMREGCAKGVFALQRHGLEHCWPASLLERARADAGLRSWLANPDARSEGLPSALQSRWVDSATLPSRSLTDVEVEAAVKEEGEVFQRIFGERPSVAVPNTFVWNSAIERAWAVDGVRCVVTCGRQYEGRRADAGLMPPTRQLFNGQLGIGNVRYVVRDVYFEPVRGHRAEQVLQGVAERTALGRPALVEMHRESFIMSAETAEQALAELMRAMQQVVQQYPDVCFLNTANLSGALAAPQSLLIVKGFFLRGTVFLRRLLATPALSRTLKICGFSFLLPMLIGVLVRVTPAPCGDQASC